MDYIIENKETCDVKFCRSKLIDIYNEDWKRLLLGKPKLRTYIELKNTFCVEQFVKLNFKRNERSILAQLRCGILPLHVETGRFVRKKVEDRICQFGTSNSIENEYHFILHCNFYSAEREVFLAGLYNVYRNLGRLGDAVKLKTLFVFEPRKLAKFVTRIWAKRQQCLYPDLN